jgi:hypothetical protein
MTVSAVAPMTWEIRSDLPGRLRLSLDGLRHSPALRQHCDTVLTACHWLHGFRLNSLAGSLSVRFPEARRAEVIDLLGQALAPPASANEADALVNTRGAGAVVPRHQQPLLLRHGTLCAVALALDLWLGLPALLINSTAALLTLPLLAHAWTELRRRPPRLTEVLDVGLSALLLRQGLGRETLIDQVLEDGSELLQRLEEEERRDAPEPDVLRRLGTLVRVRSADDDAPWALSAVSVGDRLRLEPGSRVWLALELVEGQVGVIRPGKTELWSPRAIGPGQLLAPGWLVVTGQGVGRVLAAFAEDVRFHLPPAHTLPASEDSLTQRLLRLQDRLFDPFLLILGGAWALGGATERAMAAFQFNPLSDWRTSQVALRLATRADMRLHGIHIAHPHVLVDLARVDHLLVSPDCLDRLDRQIPRERLAEASGLCPGDLLRLVANLRRHLLQPSRDPHWRPLPLEGWPPPAGSGDGPDPWRPGRVTCDAAARGWLVELEDGRQLTVIQSDCPAAVDGGHTLEVRDGACVLGRVTLERQADPAWREVCEHLGRLGIAVVPLHAPETAEDDVNWRLEAVTTLQRQGRVVAWLGDDLADIPAMTQAEVAIGLPSARSQLLPSHLLDLTVGPDPRWLPRLVGLSRELARASQANLWLIGLTHVLSSLATAGLAVTPLQMVLLADLPLLLAELNNRLARGSRMRHSSLSSPSLAPV